MKINQLLKRNLIYFYISFFSAGAVNIIPQLFYNRYYPDKKEFLLSVTLILCSLGAVLGIVVSRKLLGKVDRAIAPIFIIFVIAFCFILQTQKAVYFILMLLLASFTCNFIYNYLDNFFIDNTLHDSLEQHIKAVLIYQMFGYMLSPLFFSAFGNNKLISTGVILFLAMMITSLSLSQIKVDLRIGSEDKLRIASLKSDRFSCREVMFAGYAISYMMVEMIALASMVYILSDYYRLTDFAIKSGIAMFEILILAGITVVLVRPPKKMAEANDPRKSEYLLFNPTMNLLAVALFMLTIILLALRLSRSFAYIMLALAPAGPAYGIFLKLSRSYASTMDVKNNKGRLLSLYNNIQNISGVAGYCIVLLCWLFAVHYQIDYLQLTIAVIIGMLIIAVFFIVLWVISLQKEKAK